MHLIFQQPAFQLKPEPHTQNIFSNLKQRRKIGISLRNNGIALKLIGIFWSFWQLTLEFFYISYYIRVRETPNTALCTN